VLAVDVRVEEPHITYVLQVPSVAITLHTAEVLTYTTSHIATTIMGYALPTPHALIPVRTITITRSVLPHIPIPVAVQHAREVASATQPLSMFISL